MNFKKNSYDNPKALEDLKVMNQSDLNTLLNDDLEVWKSGHVKKLTLAIRKLQYPSASMHAYHFYTIVKVVHAFSLVESRDLSLKRRMDRICTRQHDELPKPL